MKALIKSIASVLLLSFSSLSATHAQPSRFEKLQFIGAAGDTLNYRLLFPDSNVSRKYPLVIFLHGSGERGSDNDAQLKWGAMSFATDEAMKMYPAVVIAPQCPAGLQWSNFDFNRNTLEIHLKETPSKPMELVHQLVLKLIKTMPVDTSRIYITGLSMGGFGTYDAISRYPKLFAAAVPVCGGGDTSKAPAFAHIPIWILHGSEDPVVNPLLSTEMAAALYKAGAHPGLTLYPETGHFSWLAAYSDPLVMEWMFRQHK